MAGEFLGDLGQQVVLETLGGALIAEDLCIESVDYFLLQLL